MSYDWAAGHLEILDKQSLDMCRSVLDTEKPIDASMIYPTDMLGSWCVYAW